MTKILKNQTGSAILISDTGVSIPASPSTYTVVPMDYPLWAASSDIITYIGNGSIIVNDGSFDLSKADSVAAIQGNFKQTDFISDLKNNNRLKVETIQTGGTNIQVSSDDQTSGYLEQKVIGTTNKIVVTTQNPGGDEDLKINIGSDVFDKTINTSDNVTEGSTKLFFTEERAQDAVGNILTDSSSVDLTYNDSTNTITASVLPAGVDHNQLSNLTVGDPHTQYVKPSGIVIDNSIARHDGTTGRIIQGSDAVITDSGFVGVKTQSPISELTVKSTTNISNRGISSLQYSNDLNGGKVILAKARGTEAAPLYPANGDIIGLHNFKAWDEATASWANVGYYNVNAAETHTASAKGTNIAFWTTPNGTSTPVEKVKITNTGRVELTNAITLSNTTETVNGTFRWTGTEAQVKTPTDWKVLGGTPIVLTGTSAVSTTSATYAIISGMQTTPIAGTYQLIFNCNVDLGDDTSGDIAVFVGGTEQTILTRRVAIEAAGLLGAVANFEVVHATLGVIVVNGTQQVDIRFRENGTGTLAVTERILTLIPTARPS